MSNKKYPIKLTKKQINVITSALFEYGEICDSESDQNDGTKAKGLSSVSKECDKTLSAVHKEMNKLGLK